MGSAPVRAAADVSRPRPTQAERRARTRRALLESAARGLSRDGYSSLALEQVASDAGYTRGALYHLFASKEDLALAVVWWINETWQDEVGALAQHEEQPVAALLALARGHAIYCRRDVARVRMALAVEFSGRDHPIRHALDKVEAGGVARFAKLITRARRDGTVPAGPPAKAIASGLLGALEGLVIQLAGQEPLDTLLAERLVLGLLGLGPSASPGTTAASPRAR
ncbi:MAG: TetR/AcrR family transcriptional regulator [Nocardioidaceae bacterium]